MKHILYSFFLIFSNLYYSQSQFLDSSFGNNGTLITDGGFNKDDAAYTVATTNDQKILVAGSGKNSNGISFSLLIKYNSNGTIDTSFAQNGKLIINNLMMQSYIADIKILNSGKILILGGATTSTLDDCNLFVARLNENGTLDTSFGTNGYKFIYNSEGKNIPNQLLVDANEKILVIDDITTSSNLSEHKFCIYRLNTDGNSDEIFGINGNSNNFSGAQAKANIGSNGNIIVGTSEFGNDSSFLKIYKFIANGTIDTNFNNNGFKEISFNNLVVDLNSILIDNNKIIVTASTVDVSTDQRFAIAKLNFDGTFDESFGNGGKKEFAFANNIDEFAFAIGKNSILTPDNKIIFSGFWTDNGSSSNYDFILRKTDINGNVDTSFGNNGQVNIDFGNSSIDYLFKSYLQNDGKLICIGQTRANAFSNSNFAIAKANNSVLSISELNRNKENIILNTLVKNYISFSKKINSTYQIFDYTGKLIIKGKINNTILNLSHLKKGYYLITVDGQTTKIIKE